MPFIAETGSSSRSPSPARRRSTAPGVYDRDVLYTINISNGGSATDAEFPIEFRFGRDGQAVGVKFDNVPGAGGRSSALSKPICRGAA